MAESRSVWASNAYYLNDSSEILEALELTSAVAIRKQAECDDPTRELLVQLVSWLKLLGSPQGLYVFSATEQKNDLSQWRAYSPYGKGVAIVFSPERIRRIADRNECKIVRCLYRRDEKERMAEKIVEKTIETWRSGYGQNFPGPQPPQGHHPAFESLKSHYLAIFSIFKNTNFKDEKEWRVISPLIEGHDPRVDYREGASLLIPYFKIDLSDSEYLFDQAWIGPTAHQNLSMDVLHRFVSAKKVSQECLNSQQPYREFK